ncbi:LLM class flavin-dependent oxidoreductase [Glycomyces sp. TRM65418]|uniref:LLM class flavin-dependent oxidoreductase n=1 Tax=Glycomyces sp. TRM65418 TaxID=2867006 RepID=UPI001CE5D0D5|nr:LLM class flavin-dependent oxidoreductase [Glycomyces sp. TRM65418]MCC3765138.1 LLM class flavin-dependent oxidoreductase [Glycomyces sp. TRM65418]QZD54766.1 LLM class flavin-dependent oxidoreductase [Glycomyces sp. TRM65418]
MKLSVLDVIPVRSDQRSADAIAASRALAQRADELGYERYWFAEHHNMPIIASTNPPVLIGMIAAATDRIRVGSGGVMLPNHAPLVVAEQFALLEAAFPGRIDLGIGRAPGSDPVTAWALRQNAGDDPVARFSSDVDEVVALTGGAGVAVAVRGGRHELRATPTAASAPDVWLLGSSDFSAKLAAEKGLPYVFAHHFAGQDTAEALKLYRDRFKPTEGYSEPRTFLTVNASVAETDEEALRRTLPQALAMLALRSGAPLEPQPTIEDAERVELTEAQATIIGAMRAKWVIGSPETAKARLEELRARFEVDEVMINPVAGVYAGTDPAASPAREETLRLLAPLAG